MEKGQKHRLRWEHHQPTVLSVFSTLLENEKLVDITLAAEGKHLKAHRLVLSACSPYFEKILSEEYDKHPILILKDVKFEELQAIMNFMYKGEVDISLDQVEDFIKIAEALQIKGLSEPAKQQQVTSKKRSPDDGEGSVIMSSGPQKKQRLRRNLDIGETSNSSDSSSLAQNIPSTNTLSGNITMKTDKPNTIETEPKILTLHEDEKNSRPLMDKDNLMELQNNDRVRPNLRKKTKYRRLSNNKLRDPVYLTAKQVLDTRENSQDMKIFIGKNTYTIKMSNYQYFI